MVAASSPALAHSFTTTDVLAVFDAGRHYQIDMQVDVDALALGVSPALDSAMLAAELAAMPPGELAVRIQQAQDTIRRRVRIRFDGARHTPEVSFPEQMPAPHGDPPTLLGTVARLSGLVPDQAGTFTFGASRAFQSIVLTIRDPESVLGTEFRLDVSEDSPPYTLRLAPAPTEAAPASPPSSRRTRLAGVVAGGGAIAVVAMLRRRRRARLLNQ